MKNAYTNKEINSTIEMLERERPNFGVPTTVEITQEDAENVLDRVHDYDVSMYDAVGDVLIGIRECLLGG